MFLLFPRPVPFEPLCWALWVTTPRNQHTLIDSQFGLVEVEWTKVLPRLLFSVPAEQCTISGSSRLLLLTETLIIFFISNCKWSTNRVKLFIILLRRWLELKNLLSTTCIYDDYWSIIVDWEKLLRWQKIGWEINFQVKSSRTGMLPGESAKI